MTCPGLYRYRFSCFSNNAANPTTTTATTTTTTTYTTTYTTTTTAAATTTTTNNNNNNNFNNDAAFSASLSNFGYLLFILIFVVIVSNSPLQVGYIDGRNIGNLD